MYDRVYVLGLFWELGRAVTTENRSLAFAYVAYEVYNVVVNHALKNLHAQ